METSSKMRITLCVSFDFRVVCLKGTKSEEGDSVPMFREGMDNLFRKGWQVTTFLAPLFAFTTSVFPCSNSYLGISKLQNNFSPFHLRFHPKLQPGFFHPCTVTDISSAENVFSIPLSLSTRDPDPLKKGQTTYKRSSSLKALTKVPQG